MYILLHGKMKIMEKKIKSENLIFIKPIPELNFPVTSCVVCPIVNPDLKDANSTKNHHILQDVSFSYITSNDSN